MIQKARGIRRKFVYFVNNVPQIFLEDMHQFFPFPLANSAPTYKIEFVTTGKN